MSITPRECRDAPGVYSVCLNDVCFPVTNSAVGNYLKQYETNGDCVVDELDFYDPEEVVGVDITGQVLANSSGDKSLAVASAYIQAVIETVPHSDSWRWLGDKGLDLYTKWASSVRDLDKAFAATYEESHETVSSATKNHFADMTAGYAVDACAWSHRYYDARAWQDVVVKTIGAEGDIANNLASTVCESYYRLMNDYLDKRGRSPRGGSDLGEADAFIFDLPPEMKNQGTLYMNLFFGFQAGGDKIFECAGEGCPENNSVVVIPECSMYSPGTGQL